MRAWLVLLLWLLEWAWHVAAQCAGSTNFTYLFPGGVNIVGDLDCCVGGTGECMHGVDTDTFDWLRKPPGQENKESVVDVEGYNIVRSTGHLELMDINKSQQGEYSCEYMAGGDEINGDATYCVIIVDTPRFTSNSNNVTAAVGANATFNITLEYTGSGNITLPDGVPPVAAVTQLQVRTSNRILILCESAECQTQSDVVQTQSNVNENDQNVIVTFDLINVTNEDVMDYTVQVTATYMYMLNGASTLHSFTLSPSTISLIITSAQTTVSAVISPTPTISMSDTILTSTMESISTATTSPGVSSTTTANPPTNSPISSETVAIVIAVLVLVISVAVIVIVIVIIIIRRYTKKEFIKDSSVYYGDNDTTIGSTDEHQSIDKLINSSI